VNGRSYGDCCGLIAWVSDKDYWASLQRERERERVDNRDFKKEKKNKKYYFKGIRNGK
jgi:hypothetical protein